MKYFIFVLLFICSYPLFSQNGGSGVCVVGADPNTITAMEDQDVRYECVLSYDNVNNVYYYYDASLALGSRWKILETENIPAEWIRTFGYLRPIYNSLPVVMGTGVDRGKVAIYPSPGDSVIVYGETKEDVAYMQIRNNTNDGGDIGFNDRYFIIKSDSMIELDSRTGYKFHKDNIPSSTLSARNKSLVVDTVTGIMYLKDIDSNADIHLDSIVVGQDSTFYYVGDNTISIYNEGFSVDLTGIRDSIQYNIDSIAVHRTEINSIDSLLNYHISTDLDIDTTNEIQQLTKSNDTIFLSDGGFVIDSVSEIPPLIEDQVVYGGENGEHKQYKGLTFYERTSGYPSTSSTLVVSDTFVNNSIRLRASSSSADNLLTLYYYDGEQGDVVTKLELQDTFNVFVHEYGTVDSVILRGRPGYVENATKLIHLMPNYYTDSIYIFDINRENGNSLNNPRLATTKQGIVWQEDIKLDSVTTSLDSIFFHVGGQKISIYRDAISGGSNELQGLTYNGNTLEVEGSVTDYSTTVNSGTIKTTSQLTINGTTYPIGTATQTIYDAIAASEVSEVRETVAQFNSTTYTVPAGADNIKVYVGGLLQEEGADYNISGTTITFTWTPPGIRLTLIYQI